MSGQRGTGRTSGEGERYFALVEEGRLIAEWWAPWLQDPRHVRPRERQPPMPEFDADIEEWLYHRSRSPSGNLMGLNR